MTHSSVSVFRSLLSDVAQFGGWRLWRGVAFAVMGAGLEGVGLILLLPLLQSLHVAEGTAPPLLSRFSSTLGLGGLLPLWVVVVALLAWFTARREVELVKLSQDFIRHLRQRLYCSLLGMDWSAFQQLRSAHVVEALTGTAMRVGLGLSSLIQLLAGLFLVAIHTAIALFLAPVATALAVAAGGMLAVTQFRRIRRMFRHGAAMGAGMRNVHAAVSEHLASMKLAKSHNAEAAFAAAFDREVNKLAASAVVSVDDSAQSRARQKIGAAVLLALVVWVSVKYLHVSGAPLLVLIAVFGRLLPAVAQVVQSALRVSEMLPAYAEMESLRERCLSGAAPAVDHNAAPPTGTVRLAGVTYTWPGRDRPAIAAVDVEIVENHTTALVGPSGAGKSTLADLALGLLEPTAGDITVGGLPLTGPLRAAWRQRAAVVPQEPFLFHDTVRANLLWANPAAEETDLWRALEAAAADGLVRALPLGLDTLVGDRGLRLSGGERQRLALARALLRRPSFLVLDEATSHLDHEHERLIQQSLDRLHGKLTVLVIAHRLSTVRHADAIVVIDGGTISATGSWEQLRAVDGFVADGIRRGLL